MVAKINVGSSLFGALTYNQRKIDEGEGRVLCDDAGNKVGNPFKSSLFEKSAGYNAIQERCEKSKEVLKDKRLKERTKQSVATAMRQASNRSAFEKELLKNGIDTVIRQNDTGRIYGITFIDHHTKCVLNGSRLRKEFSANNFNELFHAPLDEREKHPLQEDKESSEISFELLSRTQRGTETLNKVWIFSITSLAGFIW